MSDEDFIRGVPIYLVKMIRKYKKDFEENTLPELRKRTHALSKSQRRREKDKSAQARRKKDERKADKDESRKNRPSSEQVYGLDQ